MPSKPLAALALATALRSAGATVDVSALVQRTVVHHGEGPANNNQDYDEGWMYRAGERVELEGYGPDRNVTILSRGRGKDRYNLNMEGQGIYNNIEGKFLKKWKEPYPRSTDPEAGPIAHIMHFNYKSKPWIVRRGNPGTWDVYIPGNGFVPNVPDSDIIREKSWYLAKTHKAKHGPAAVLVGKMPEKLPSRSGAKSNADELVILSKNTVASPVTVPFPAKPAAQPAAPLKVAPAAEQKERVALNAVEKPLADLVAKVEESAVEESPAAPTGMSAVEKMGKAFKQTMKAAQVAIPVAMAVAQKGPTKFLRDTLPLGLGRVFVNEKTEVHQCGDISSALYCQASDKMYNITCAGWTGSACLSKAEATSCDVLTSEGACHKSSAKFGLECAGWGGSSCLAKDSSCSAITDPITCGHASAKLGMECAGWGGSVCLEKGAEASKITSESICARSAEALGIESAGWSGSSCLKAGEVKCSAITHAGICRDAKARLGVSCAGWSGAECLAKEDAACEKLVTKPICEKAYAKIGVTCAWTGDRCAPDNAGVKFARGQ